MLRSVVRRICSSACTGSGGIPASGRAGGRLQLIRHGQIAERDMRVLKPAVQSVLLARPISLYAQVQAEEKSKEVVEAAAPEEEVNEGNNNEATPTTKKSEEPVSEKDRTKVIPVETSIRYLQSEAFKQTYQGNPVWVLYRRNFKGQFAPKRTRKTCIRQGMLTTGNACPICRDEYLVLDYRNIELLKQFISPFNGDVLSFTKTGLCQKRHAELLVAILKAKDRGLITYDVPFREYDYSEYGKIYESYKLN